ncbi:hypothetical protein AB0F11_11220 [Streptomyces sp. NPDC032472]|uniref:hypothetical protein n=1 Tax=Streptomyces sp. NPDC032472 TaxID=3155018 RepID=UPI0033DA846B
MTVREIRAAARMVGRRTALRYLALGAGAALVSACTGKDKPAGPATPTATATPGPTTGSASPSASATAPAAAPPSVPSASPASGVVGHAFAEFVKGAWTISSTLPGGDNGAGRKDTGRAAVNPDGTWTIIWTGLNGIWSGRWSLQRGRLDLQVLTGPKHLTDPDISTSSAQKVPDTVDGPTSQLLNWFPMGAQDVFGHLDVAYNGKDQLRIHHLDLRGNISIHMCTRA